MMLSRQEEQEERKQVIANERRLRNQATTFSQFGESDAATSLGRFSAVSNATVIGSTPTPAAAYPAAFLQHDPVPDENPLGVDINDMPPCGEPHEVRASKRSVEPSSTTDLAPSAVPPFRAVEQGHSPNPAIAPTPLAAERGLGTFRRF